MPAVGKSGAGIISIKSSIEQSGLLNKCKAPLMTSVMLCGGILVAMPTAIPEAPLINKLGIRVGKTEGSFSLPS